MSTITQDNPSDMYVVAQSESIVYSWCERCDRSTGGKNSWGEEGRSGQVHSPGARIPYRTRVVCSSLLSKCALEYLQSQRMCCWWVCVVCCSDRPPFPLAADLRSFRINYTHSLGFFTIFYALFAYAILHNYLTNLVPRLIVDQLRSTVTPSQDSCLYGLYGE